MGSIFLKRAVFFAKGTEQGYLTTAGGCGVFSIGTIIRRGSFLRALKIAL